jgi:hypothetical protein
MNRSVDGDLVAVEVFPEEMWRGEGEVVVDHEGIPSSLFEVTRLTSIQKKEKTMTRPRMRAKVKMMTRMNARRKVRRGENENRMKREEARKLQKDVNLQVES